MPHKYDALPDPYLYEDGLCLRNIPGLRDPDLLAAFESEQVRLRAEEPMPKGRFTPSHYRRLHRHLFQDVYDWAGRYRTVRMTKGTSMFCYPEFIARQMDVLFQTLKEPTLKSATDLSSFVERAARFLSELNAIHPFREGNGRAQLAFIRMIALRAGNPLRMERLLPERFLDAMIASFNDELAPLIDELENLIA